MTARKPAAKEAVFTDDPDRPLLRLLNRADGKPVLAMCGLPGNHDPAHAAAGRLPVRFHRFSDVRLYWREFKGGYRPDQQQRFAALILLTNTEKPIVDERSMAALMDFRDQGLPALWGEVSPEGAVMWQPEFHVTEIEVGPELYMGGIGDGHECVFEEGNYQWVCGSHHRLVPGPA
jgi:hypothetical protein